MKIPVAGAEAAICVKNGVLRDDSVFLCEG